MRREAFTQAAAAQYWQQFCDQLQASGDPIVYQELANNFELQKGTEFHTKVTDMALNFVKEKQRELVLFLREKLQNDGIQVQVGVKQAAERKTQAFTPAERLNEMMKKNPALKELKDRLGLDPDF